MCYWVTQRKRIHPWSVLFCCYYIPGKYNVIQLPVNPGSKVQQIGHYCTNYEALLQDIGAYYSFCSLCVIWAFQIFLECLSLLAYHHLQQRWWCSGEFCCWIGCCRVLLGLEVCVHSGQNCQRLWRCAGEISRLLVRAYCVRGTVSPNQFGCHLTWWQHMAASGREKQELLWGHKYLKHTSLVCGAQIVHVITLLISGYTNSEDSDHLGMYYCKEQNDCLKTRKCVCGPRSFSIISLFPSWLYCLLPPKRCR